MASKQLLIVLVAVAILPVITTAATKHMVGDDGMWSLNVNYSRWAEGKTFRVGDSLVFMYDASKHDVLKTSGPDFRACNRSGALGSFTSGNDEIPLTSTGNKWYICGKADHCSRGMKLVIKVLPSLVTAPSPAPSANDPPQTGSSIRAATFEGLMPVAVAAAIAFFTI